MECDAAGNELVGPSASFMSTVFLLWLAASHLTSHILPTRAVERRNMSRVTHTHTQMLLPSTPPSCLSYMHAYTHIHISSGHLGSDSGGSGL